MSRRRAKISVKIYFDLHSGCWVRIVSVEYMKSRDLKKMRIAGLLRNIRRA
jgi:hypothetical protein